MSYHETENSDPPPQPEQPSPPQWKNLQDVLGCVLAALIDAAPVFAESFFNCVNGSGPPTDDGYRPGGRKRCP